MASAGQPAEIYKAGLNTTRLLMALGDLVIGWLLLTHAEVALRRLDEIAPGHPDRDFYAGKLGAGVPHSLLFLGIERFKATGRAFETHVHRLVVAHRDDDIGSNAPLVNDLVAGGIIFGRRQAQGRAVLQRQNALHGTFAKSLLAEDKGMAETQRGAVLQTAGHDL